MDETDDMDDIERITTISMNTISRVIEYMFIWVKEEEHHRSLLQLLINYSGLRCCDSMHGFCEMNQTKLEACLLLLSDSPNFHMIKDAFDHLQNNNLQNDPYKINCKITKDHVEYFK
jgi:hypothetical protein